MRTYMFNIYFEGAVNAEFNPVLVYASNENSAKILACAERIKAGLHHRIERIVVS